MNNSHHVAVRKANDLESVQQQNHKGSIEFMAQRNEG